MKKTLSYYFSIVILGTIFFAPVFLVLAGDFVHTDWFNGTYADDTVWDYTIDLAHPNYGTHDWIADHAKNLLPPSERQWIDNNYTAFLLGTEAPDNAGLDFLGPNTGYGDFSNHEVWFDSNGNITKDDSARRAQEEYTKAASALPWNEQLAAYYAGALTHYIDDVAVFAHVLGSGSHWGTEAHHAEYERGVDYWTRQYNGGGFESYLHPAPLTSISAFDATIALARSTDTGIGDTKSAGWMNANFPLRNDTFYIQDNPTYTRSAGDSLNRAVNAVANVLHTLSVQKGYTIERLPAVSNSDRIDTAISISQKLYPSFGSARAVALVGSNDIASALVAAPFMKQLDGVVLLTPTYSLSSRAANEIARLIPNSSEIPIYIVGNVNSVWPEVETSLHARFLNSVTRIGGVSNAETSVLIASRMAHASSALLANLNGIDAVAAAGAASNRNIPLLLTDGGSLSSNVSDFLTQDAAGQSIRSITVLGGKSAVGDTVTQQLQVLGRTTTRLGGQDRFETAQILNQNFYSSPESVIIANGYSAIDAVTGAGLAGRYSAPILLTSATSIPDFDFGYLAGHAGTLTHGYVFGGTAAVSYYIERTFGLWL